MIEIVKSNFSEHLPAMLAQIKAARFIAIDTEFSALYLDEAAKPSLSDTPAERYAKLRATCGRILPIQVGLSMFTFDADANRYTSSTYTVYVWPQRLMHIDPVVQFQASSMQFLRRFGFDFNKLVDDGVHFLDETAVAALADGFSDAALTFPDECYVDSVSEEVNHWFHHGDDAAFVLQDAYNKLNGDLHALHCVQRHLRATLRQRVTTRIVDGDLVLQRCEADDATRTELVEATLREATGFTHVVRALREAGKPIVGHNMLMDVLLVLNTFCKPLPETYSEFKMALHDAFPSLWDTRSMTAELVRLLGDDLRMKGSLHELYEYFLGDRARNAAMKAPAICMAGRTEAGSAKGAEGTMHNAGWDSYCTGYIFVRMAHHFTVKKYGGVTQRTVMSGEHIAAVEPYRNRVNLIRAACSHIVIDGDDPVSRRPPCFLIRAKRTKRDTNSHIFNISPILSSFGYVEIKQLNDSSALVSIDNWSTSRRIVKYFSKNDEFSIIEHDKYLRRKRIQKCVIGIASFLALAAYFSLRKH